MKRILIVLSLITLNLLSSSCGLLKLKSEPPQINDRIHILGPEVAPFCNGWVEVWARVDTTAWKREVQVYLKASPANGAGWTITNDHLLIELPKEQASKRRRLRDIKQIEFDRSTKMEVPSDPSNVGEWRLSVEGLDPSLGLKVFLKPFDGCPKDQKNVLSFVIRDRELD